MNSPIYVGNGLYVWVAMMVALQKNHSKFMRNLPRARIKLVRTGRNGGHSIKFEKL